MPLPECNACFTPTAEGALLRLHLRPGAKQDGVSGFFGNALKIELKTPPVDGRANAALLRFLAKELKISRAQIVLKSGECCRDKVLEIAGCPAEKIAEWIQSKC